ncbi:MAG: DUF2330 domain-containing protein [Deltaproteobacteria bacterium]|nr:DUF2330 domain-containing protein [Deltaproteobacteria bacterium]
MHGRLDREHGTPARAVALGALGTFLLGALAPAPAAAFCGFMVSSGADTPTNKGSMVALMRDGSRTVVAMQNDYAGPPEDFALVIPVPEVLEEGQVRTLEKAVFARLDTLTAPRLVEYWEQDPCYEPVYYDEPMPGSVEERLESDSGDDDDWEEPEDLGVTVEAEYAVGEYDILILGARDSAGLDTWLRRNGYAIPDGAERVLRAYVEQDMKFFVAKVAAERVTFDPNGGVVLSPLRFHYESEQLFLPIRLGLLNANGSQDVIVHVLARGLRYEVSNYDNYAIPTNLRVTDAVREAFPSFYDALFERMTEMHPRAVITEYAWETGSCDPCPGPTLTAEDLVLLGADVIPTYEQAIARGRVQTGFERDFVVTRLHLRYSEQSIGEDLFFRAAPPIEGGRGTPGVDGEMSQGVRAYSLNNFQGRYAILHEWEGELECPNPRRGVWGGPPSTVQGTSAPMAAAGLAFATPVASSLDTLLAGPAPELGRSTDTLPSGDVSAPPPPELPGASGCGHCAASGGGGAGAVVLVALVLVGIRRRRG